MSNDGELKLCTFNAVLSGTGNFPKDNFSLKRPENNDTEFDWPQESDVFNCTRSK